MTMTKPAMGCCADPTGGGGADGGPSTSQGQQQPRPSQPNGCWTRLIKSCHRNSSSSSSCGSSSHRWHESNCRRCSRRSRSAGGGGAAALAALAPSAPYQYVILLQLLILIAGCQAIISDDLVVETTKGKIRGVTLKSATNRDVDVWYGIPFAQPPLDDLRFRHPRPMDPWDGILETTKKPNTCVQIIDTVFPGFIGAEMWNPNTPISEDCLYINVVVPKPHPVNSAVLVWIYGGGFFGGTSTLDVYDMRVLAAEENIILVSMQYRVGSLGFLYFGQEDVPGNAGLFDQHMALQWVHDNIAQFGGNPDNITIFGESAGAVSVSLHLLSPLSRNLFSQAIMQSGSAIVPWGIITKEESTLRGLRLAEIMKCPKDRSQMRKVIECLRTKNATELVNSEWNGIVFGIAEFPFVPVIDGSFLDETPQKSLDTMNFKKTNIMTGVNKDEGVFFIMYYLTELFRNEENVYVNRDEFIEAVDSLNRYLNKVGQEAVIFEYTNWLDPDSPTKNREALDRMVGDYSFTCPVVDFSHRYAETGNNVYMYYFTERASTNPWPTWSGVLHADEIAFIFGEPLNRSKNYDQREIALSKQMMHYWANFAKTGIPSLSGDRAWAGTTWPRHTSGKREVLELNADPTQSRIIDGHRVKKCAFWKKFLPRLLELNKGCDTACCVSAGQTTAGATATAKGAVSRWSASMVALTVGQIASAVFMSAPVVLFDLRQMR